MWYSNLEETFICWYVPHRHWCSCPITLPVHWKSHHRRLLTVVSASSTSPFQFFAMFLSPVVNCVRWLTLPTTHRKYLWRTFACLFAHKKKKKKKKHTQENYWYQPPNMHMRICYLRVLWSWTVLLPRDMHRKPIMSITPICDLLTDSPSYMRISQ
jgi:hypothetical protein